MRKLKFTFSRVALNQIYLSYLLPIIEYSCVVWDGCTVQDINSLQKLQNEAARIVTGLTRSVSLDNLYRECGWVSLAERRRQQTLIFMYKSINGLVPTYVSDLIPPSVVEISTYTLRKQHNITMQDYESNTILLCRTEISRKSCIPSSISAWNSLVEISTYTLRKQRNITMQDYESNTVLLCRTEILRKSCIPSSISAWNSLDIQLRNSPSLASFRYQLKKLQNYSSVPTYYRTGSRYLSVLHARIRNNCSNLLSDLYINHLSPSFTCSCSEEVEDADHYFFNCPNYNNESDALLRDFYPLNIYILPFGDENLTAEENTIIFTAVQTFIKDTRRFTN